MLDEGAEECLLRSVSSRSRYRSRLRGYRLLIAVLAASAVVTVSALTIPSAHGVTFSAGTRSGRSPSASPSRSGSRRRSASPVPPATAAPLLAPPTRAAGAFVVLQMNLCNSGMALSCYSFGRAVDEAVVRIHKYAPDMVTVQEVCHDDVYATDGWGPLAQAMADLYGGEHVFADFVPAVDRRTGEGFRCVNGQYYGVAVISHGTGDTHYGWYRSQDSTPEERAWTCTTVVVGRLTGCTTHLSTHRDVAMRQCHELMSILDSPWVLPEVVVSGDFNLTANPGRPHNVRGCVPAGYHRTSDDALQQVLFTSDVHWSRGWYMHMRWTDHPMLYEWFRI